MKHIVLLLVLLVVSVSLSAQTQQQRLEKHLYYLASDSLRGRLAGSADGRKAAEYIEKEYRQMGLKPLFDSYRQYFTLDIGGVVTTLSMATKTVPEETSTNTASVYCNIVGVIEGSDPLLKDEYIVVGGHYDHLGVKNGEVYNGADDNASGTAAVMEMTRQLLRHRSELKRSVIVCAFDAEEIGLLGSVTLAKELQRIGLIDKVKMMMSVDMVGWLEKGGSLKMTGTGTLSDCADLLRRVASEVNIPLSTHRFESSPFTATDTQPFAQLGVPTLAVTTGLKSPYHKSGDDPELIDYPGLSKVTDYLVALTLRMASAQEPMKRTGHLAAKHRNRRNLFEAGLMLGYNTSTISFPEAAFNGKKMYGWEGGLSTRLNFAKHAALQLDAAYHLSRASYPDPADVYHGKLTYRRQSLRVPATLLFYIGNPSISFDFGAGVYYDYGFQTTLDGLTPPITFRQHQWGWHWMLGDSMGPIYWQLIFSHPFDDLFPSDVAQPSCKLGTVAFTLGFLF